MGKFSDNAMAGIVWDQLTLALGALAADSSTQINSKIDNARENGFRVLRTDYTVGITYLPGTHEGDGPFAFGLQVNASNAELQEIFDADPQSSINRNLNEESSRPCWLLGVLGPPQSASGSAMSMVTGTVNIKWSIPEGSNLKWWVYNMTSLAANSGMVLEILAKHYGVWLKD